MSNGLSRRLTSERWTAGAAIALSALIAGCDAGPATAPVTGTVTLDGEPLRFGKVMFQSVEGGQPARGEIGADGAFALGTFRRGDGAIVGTHRVRVVCYSSQDPANAGKGPAGDSLGRLLIPERYTSLGASGLTAEVPSGGLTEYTIELSSQRPGR